MLEQEIESLLLRVVPDLAGRWRGASENEIDEIERLAGRELPAFYRWFLSKLGGDPGPLGQAYGMFTASAVLAAHRKGTVDVEPPFLFIGRKPDPVMPLDVYYDLDRPARNDAMVMYCPSEGGIETPVCETLREHLAWTALRIFVVEKSPQRCFGVFKHAGGDVSGQLDAVMSELGFTSPISTGQYCGLYERDDVTIVARVVVDPKNSGVLVYTVGGQHQNSIRRLLGEIGTRSQLEVDADRWTPSLSR